MDGGPSAGRFSPTVESDAADATCGRRRRNRGGRSGLLLYMEYASIFRAALAALFMGLLSAAAHAVPAHYIVVHEDAAGQLKVTHRSIVELDAIPQLAPAAEWDGHGNRQERRLSVRAVKGNAVVFQTDVATASHIRHEATHGHAMGESVSK